MLPWVAPIVANLMMADFEHKHVYGIDSLMMCLCYGPMAEKP